MKAIACPQCGALIKTVSQTDKIALCEYCEAKVILPDERRADNADKVEKKTTQNYRRVQERSVEYDAPYTYPQEDNNRAVLMPLFAVFAAIGLVILIGANTKNCLSRPLDAVDNDKTPFRIANTPKIDYPVSTPAPYVSYQVKVQWQGNYDMEHFENPQIDYSKLPSFDEKELKKTVFKNRAVQVRITIDTDGAVTNAEAISGHPILKEAAVEAARKSIFNSRLKPTTRILTYYFHLTGEK